MKYLMVIMIVLLVLATLTSLGVIIASFFTIVGSLYIWITLFILSAGNLAVYVHTYFGIK